MLPHPNTKASQKHASPHPVTGPQPFSARRLENSPRASENQPSLQTFSRRVAQRSHQALMSPLGIAVSWNGNWVGTQSLIRLSSCLRRVVGVGYVECFSGAKDWFHLQVCELFGRVLLLPFPYGSCALFGMLEGLVGKHNNVCSEGVYLRTYCEIGAYNINRWISCTSYIHALLLLQLAQKGIHLGRNVLNRDFFLSNTQRSTLDLKLSLFFP